MSNWGIGLITSPGPGGRADTLVLRDVEARCPSCGLETVQRFYESTSLHAFTLPRLRALVDKGGPALSETCAQCGADVGAADVVRWVVHGGFASGAGLVQGFATSDGGRRWLLSPHRRLDVQLVPAWDADADASQVELETIDDNAMRGTFGRVWNPKEGARRWLASTRADGELRVHRLAPGLWLARAAHGTAAADRVTRAVQEAAGAGSDWVLESLVLDGLPENAWPHAPSGWLGGLDAALSGLDVCAVALADRVKPALERIIATFPVQMPVDERGDGVLQLTLPELGDWPEHPVVDARDVAREAARTLVDVDDMSRVELDRLLAALTGLLDEGESA